VSSVRESREYHIMITPSFWNAVWSLCQQDGDEEEATRYRRCYEIAGMLEPETDYKLFEKEKQVTLTDAGMTKTEGLLGGLGCANSGLLIINTPQANEQRL
jgi:preprotein translocase subunit SecA